MIVSRGLRFVSFMLLCLIGTVATVYAAPPRTVFAYAATAQGNIYGFRVAEDGDLKPLEKAAATSVMEHPMLAAHPSGRYLYAAKEFEQDKEGYILDDERPFTPRRLTTELRVLRVEGDGSLRPVQTMTVKGLVGGLRPHPGGKYLYCVCTEGRVIIYRVGADGMLAEQGRTEVFNTFSGSNIPGAYGGWDVTFTPDMK